MARERSSSSALYNLTEHASFIGPKVPDSVKKMVPLANKMDRAKFKNIMQVCLMHLEEHPSVADAYQKLKATKIEENTLGVVYAGVLLLLQLAMRHSLASLKEELFMADLQEIRLSKDCSQDFCSTVFSKRHNRILELSSRREIRLPAVSAIKWRIDVAISTSSLNRVLEPSVLMELTLGDGSVELFEVSMSKFHELRYNVAYVLKEMDNLESRSILKI